MYRLSQMTSPDTLPFRSCQYSINILTPVGRNWRLCMYKYVSTSLKPEMRSFGTYLP
ncbi:hypothetical protein K435DRAFT_377669 [Dendrothele bispora CBS 962.96]|uniref:Uncharacterized protein n=1 Tax=Dendrothele bispora (strain CBS 962.96) TaxID=1314807 RepID=A0A4S8LC22_DENBC|nr:hypothetical protein K435DRAFT_377669 [Dendrothele bispora CBS 962.96]